MLRISKMIPFNKAVYFDETVNYIADILKNGRVAEDEKYTKLCSE